jgi:hypothetical protein
MMPPMQPGAGMPPGMPPGMVDNGMFDPDMGSPAEQDDLTGPMAAPEPVMEAGGDSIAALLAHVDDPDVLEMLRRQDEERRSLAMSLEEANATASQALLAHLASMGESVDMGGGPVGGGMG